MILRNEVPPSNNFEVVFYPEKMALKQNKSIRNNWVNRPNAKLYRKFLSIFCMMMGPSRCSLPRFKIIHGRVGTHPMVIGVSSRMPWRTNFQKLCSSTGRLHSLIQDSSCLKSSAKIWKNIFCSPHRISLKKGDPKLKPPRQVLRQFRHKALNPSVWLLSFRF